MISIMRVLVTALDYTLDLIKVPIGGIAEPRSNDFDLQIPVTAFNNIQS
jgi:hypothetical protein